MYKVYACLLGQWTELTENDYQIGDGIQFFSPYNWAKDGYIKNSQNFIEKMTALSSNTNNLSETKPDIVVTK
mgnify:CR=1 FL=1